ncbi:MAG: hypothetical protein ABI361_09430 [Nitrososphaera sp.]
MADATSTYAIVAGIFAFLAAILFASRAKRYRAGYTPSGGHAEVSEA